jgi:phenylalanyl-tRNA synthetase beta chain
MRVSYRWLCELLVGLDATADEVAARLDASGLAVEAVHRLGVGLDRVVIAEVRRAEPHPKRSALQLVSVRDGSSEQRVVCGASNVPQPGGLVALARVGTQLAGLGATLEAREIGGVRSEGMLCSEAELGLSDVSEGIIALEPGSARPGAPLTEVFPFVGDVIFELDITPNRPDALGHVGVAREVAALFRRPFSAPEPGAPRRTADAALADLLRVENRDVERCPHYGAAVVLGVCIAPSPAWLRYRLHTLGVRPISNVVDVTNLLLLEFGQPLHAFDLDRVRGQTIIVRRAQPSEPFTTLDGVERRLDPDDLVICDAEAPSALAGVMGGLDSEIRNETQRVLLECAYFSPRGIRRSARRHGMHTESSHRFERGVDWGAVPSVLERAKVLLTELADGAAVHGAIHAKGPDPELPKITLRSTRLDALLGDHIPFAEATAALERLGFAVLNIAEGEKGPVAEMRGASWRPDVEREVDLIEEVARQRGLDSVPTVLPPIRPARPRPTGKLEHDAARHAVALGLSEALTYAFVSRRELEIVRAPPPVVVLENPLTEERSVMRTSLLPGLLEALRRARRRGERTIRLFTVGARFLPPSRRSRTDAARAARPSLPEDADLLPEERPSFAAVLAGPRPEYLSLKPAEFDVWDAKGVAVDLVERLTGRRPDVAHGQAVDHLHPRGAAELRIDATRVGVLGPLHPDLVDVLDLDGAVQIVELDLAAIEAFDKLTPRFRPIPKLPPVTRDLSLVVREDIPVGQVQALLAGEAGELCETIELVSVFSGGSVPAGCRSLTFHFVFRDPKSATHPEAARTLTDLEVDERQAALVRAAGERLGATLRG